MPLGYSENSVHSHYATAVRIQSKDLLEFDPKKKSAGLFDPY